MSGYCVLSPVTSHAPRGRGFDSRSVTFPPPGFTTQHTFPLLLLRPRPQTLRLRARASKEHCAYAHVGAENEYESESTRRESSEVNRSHRHHVSVSLREIFGGVRGEIRISETSSDVLIRVNHQSQSDHQPSQSATPIQAHAAHTNSTISL